VPFSADQRQFDFFRRFFYQAFKLAQQHKLVARPQGLFRYMDNAAHYYIDARGGIRLHLALREPEQVRHDAAHNEAEQACHQ
jgi:hypothetical protein